MCSAGRSSGRPAGCSRRAAPRSRKAGELDNRGSHAYLAIYWAAELAEQTDDADLAAAVAPLAERLAADEERIIEELNGVQGSPVEIGGYFHPDTEAVVAAMRPSQTLNAVLDDDDA